MQLIPFDLNKLPAHITKRKPLATNDLVGNTPSGGFPVISIKGKVFHIQRGDERSLITKPGEDDPAASIEVVVLRANPNLSKVYYSEGYQEGSVAKPTCYSNNGKTPEKDAQEPQAKNCATCAHAQWGSRISDSGKKGKACSDSRRIAIATSDTPADPILLRIPAASMRALVDHGKLLAAKGVEPHEVVTRIGFDYSVAHPALTFKPVGFISDSEAMEQIDMVRNGELVGQIIGTIAADFDENSEDAADRTPAAIAAPIVEAPKPKAAAPKAAPKPAPKPEPVEIEDVVEAATKTAATTKKADVKVEAPAAGIAKMEADLNDMLDGIVFSD